MSFSHCRRSVSVFFVSRFFKCDSLSFFLLFFCLFRPKSTSYSLSCFTVLRVGVFFHFSSSQFNVLSQTRCYFSPPFLLSVLLKYYRRGTSWCLVFLFFFRCSLRVWWWCCSCRCCSRCCCCVFACCELYLPTSFFSTSANNWFSAGKRNVAFRKHTLFFLLPFNIL